METLSPQDQRALGLLQAAIVLGPYNSINAQIEIFMNNYEDEILDTEAKVNSAIREIENSGPLFVKFVDYVLDQFKGNKFVVCTPDNRFSIDWFTIWFEIVVHELNNTFFTKDVLVSFLEPAIGRTATLYFKKGMSTTDISCLLYQMLDQTQVKLTGHDSTFIHMRSVVGRESPFD